jgi:hypothetical protein
MSPAHGKFTLRRRSRVRLLEAIPGSGTCVRLVVMLCKTGHKVKSSPWHCRVTLTGSQGTRAGERQQPCSALLRAQLNYSAANVAPTQKDQPLFSSKRRPHFETHKWP